MNGLLNEKRTRIWELDFIRGICIVLLIIDSIMFHFYYYIYFDEIPNIAPDSLIKLFSNFCTWFICFSYTRNLTRLMVLFAFFTISGISSMLSKHNLKRFIILLSYSLFMVLVDINVSKITYLRVLPNYGIFFAYAFSILLISIIKNFNGKMFYILNSILILCCVVLIICGYDISASPFRWFGLSEKLGIRRDDFVLLPIVGISLFGSIAGRIFYSCRKSMWTNSILNREKFFTFCGRHSLLIYIIGQTIIPCCFVPAALLC